MQLIGEKGTSVLGEAAARSEGFKRYVESPAFVSDLDELGARLGLTPEQMMGTGLDHWDRVNPKLAALARHAAIETLIGTRQQSAAALTGLVARRYIPELSLAFAGAEVLRIAFHCFQIYSRRRQLSGSEKDAA
jgi:hypothetical protein